MDGGQHAKTDDDFASSSISQNKEALPLIVGETYLPGTTSLLADLDKKLLVVLRDGRTLIGYLRSIDQFANLVLHRTIERIYVGKKYGDIPRGIFLIRGENVALIGEIDLSKEEVVPLTQVDVEEILELQRLDAEAKQKLYEARKRALTTRGLGIHAEGLGLQEEY